MKLDQVLSENKSGVVSLNLLLLNGYHLFKDCAITSI